MIVTVAFLTQGSQLYFLSPAVSPATLVTMAQLQGLSGIGGVKSSIKLTNFDSPGYDEYAPGYTDPGKPTGNVILNFGSTAHQALQTLLGLGAGAVSQFFYAANDNTTPPTIVTAPPTLTPPKTTGSFNRSGWLWTGFVNEFSQTAAVNNVIMAKFGCQATGAIGMIVKGSTTAF